MKKQVLNYFEKLQQYEEDRRKETLEFLPQYLALAPLGRRSETEHRLPLKFRLELYNQRGRICEVCNASLTATEFEVHHINYQKENASDYLKIVCIRCHTAITNLTDAIRRFEGFTAHRSKLKKPDDPYFGPPPV